MEDKYTGDPPELSDVPVFDTVKYLVWDIATARAYPSVDTQQVEATGSLWEFCVEKISGPIWAEFGVMLGRSARYFLEYLPDNGEFYLFDSFEGLPEAWHENPKGKFAVKSNGYAIPDFHDSRTKVIEGWFEDVLPVDATFDFVHIDCDLYSSTKTVLENIKVRPGTIMLFDELWGYKVWKEHEWKALMEWDVPFKFIARDVNQRAVIEIL